MGWFSKKNNGINWQQEVLDTSKAVPAILKELEGMNKGYTDHVEAGRQQRIEDKERRAEDKNWQTLLLDNSLKCAEEKRIVNLESDMKDLKTDKILKTGKFLGMKRIWIIVIGVGAVVMLVLNVIWKLWKMGML